MHFIKDSFHTIKLQFSYIDQCINSIDRGLLNRGLLEEISEVENIAIFFRHKLTTIDFDGRCMTVSNGETGKDVIVTFDLCIGADGSYSNVRRQMMRVVRYAPWSCAAFLALNKYYRLTIQNEFPTGVHTTRIHGIKNSGRSRGCRASHVCSGPEPFAYMATAFLYAYSASQ